MKRKIMTFLLAGAMMISAVGCGCGTVEQKPAETTPPTEEVQTPEQEETVQDNTVQDDTEVQVPEEGNDNTTSSTAGIGTALLEKFHAVKQENPEITAQEMADSILSHEIIQFDGATMPVEEGLLTGFGNAEIIGFKEGIMFAPMIGSIPFVGYVFTLEEGADVSSFITLLEENADPRWNICTEAEETIVESADSMVFFLMCPSQFE